jgi:hypothetical protein
MPTNTTRLSILENSGKLYKDAEEEVFGIRGWTEVPGYSEDYRWQAIRDSLVGCEIDDLFMEYIGKEAPRPTRPDASIDPMIGEEPKRSAGT